MTHWGLRRMWSKREYGSDRRQIYRTVSVPLDRLVNDGLADAADGKDSPDPRMLSAPVYTLSINCRNTPRIAACAPLLGGLTPDYSQIRRPDDHINPELLFVKEEAAQVRLLADLLERFRSEEKFRGDEMVLPIAPGAQPLRQPTAFALEGSHPALQRGQSQRPDPVCDHPCLQGPGSAGHYRHRC